MPEGHTILRLARDLRRDLGGRPLRASSPQGRFASGAATIDGSVLTRASAHGKHLFLTFDPPALGPGSLLHIHLGLFGRFRRHEAPVPDPTEAVRLRLAGVTATWDLAGATACELMDGDGVDRLRARLGPDPLRRDARPDEFVVKVRARHRPIGALLLDQSVIAGIGNVYRNELCFRHGIDPRTPGSALDPSVVRAIWDDAVALLAIGVRLGRIVTVDPADAAIPGLPTAVGRLGPDDRVYVYRRAHCRRCGAPVSWFDLGNRRAYACPVEQPWP